MFAQILGAAADILGDIVATITRSHEDYCEEMYAENERHSAELFEEHRDWNWGDWEPGQPLSGIPILTWMFRVDTV